MGSRLRRRSPTKGVVHRGSDAGCVSLPPSWPTTRVRMMCKWDLIYELGGTARARGGGGGEGREGTFFFSVGWGYLVQGLERSGTENGQARKVVVRPFGRPFFLTVGISIVMGSKSSRDDDWLG
jgi:hypothetical protein